MELTGIEPELLWILIYCDTHYKGDSTVPNSIMCQITQPNTQSALKINVFGEQLYHVIRCRII
jgi:hypothetical protein